MTGRAGYRAGAGERHRAGGDVGIGRRGQRQEQTHGGVHGYSFRVLLASLLYDYASPR
jgi:hypothetical protein